MAKLRPLVRKDSYMPNRKWIPFVIGNGYTTVDGNKPEPDTPPITLGPAPIVSFNSTKASPMRKLLVDLSPVQDLHGYDSPWPAGGHYNQWDEVTEMGLWDTTTGEPLQSNAQIRNTTPFLLTPDRSYYIVCSKDLWAMFYDADGNLITDPDTVSGFPRSVNAYNIKAKTLTTPTGAHHMNFYFVGSYGTTYLHDTAINYPSTVTTYSPYSNECPILGWSEVTVEQRGKNLLPTSAQDSNTWHVGTVETNGYRYYVCNLPAGTVYVHSPHEYPYNDKLYCRIATYGADGNRISANAWLYHPSNQSLNNDFVSVTIPTGGHIQLEAYGNAGEAFDGNLWITLAQDAPYTPYNPLSRSISITIGQTVYGGTLDVLTGVLTVDMGFKTYAASEVSAVTKYTYNNISYGYVVSPAGIKNQYTYRDTMKIVCDRGAVYRAAGGFDTASNVGKIVIAAEVQNLWFGFAKGTTEADMKTALDGMTVAYELATPQTIQLTPQEVKQLVGENHVWSSAGDVTVEVVNATPIE